MDIAIFTETLEFLETRNLGNIRAKRLKFQNDILLAAIEAEDTDTVSQLLAGGIDTNFLEQISNVEEERRVCWTMMKQSSPIVMFETIDELLQGRAQEISDCSKCSQLPDVFLSGSPITAVFAHFVRQVDTPLSLAASAQGGNASQAQVDICKMLLDHGAEINTDCGRFVGALHVTIPERVVYLNKVNIMQMFIEYGYNVDNLHEKFVAKAKEEMLMILVEAGIKRELLKNNGSNIAKIASCTVEKPEEGEPPREPKSLMYQCREKICEVLCDHSEKNLWFLVKKGDTDFPQHIQDYLLEVR